MLSLISCSTTTLKPTEATHKKGEGRLISSDGIKFSYNFYPSHKKGPSVIYIAGMSGKVTRKGKGGYVLVPPLNRAGFNFIGFDRPGYEALLPQSDKINIVKMRSKSGHAMFPTNEGLESGAQNIVRNEIQTVIEFIERAPTYDPEKGIYLIGGSFGSWISLITVLSFPDKVKGVVFLSPAIPPEMVGADRQAEKPMLNISNYFESLINNFGQRPALAIGSKKDIIVPGRFKDGSAFDSAQLLRAKIGSNIEIMEVSSSLHSRRLVESNRKVKDKIVQWLINQAGKH
jgi:pimeloyl-ACP methyl ester carboxylesterase